MALRDAEAGHRLRQRLRPHRGATVGVDDELAWRDVLPRAAFGDEVPGERTRLPLRDQPAHDVAAEDVEQDVEVVVGPRRRPEQFRDVPAPHLVRPRRDQLRLGIRRVQPLSPALAHLLVCGEDAVHGPDGAKVFALIEQLSVDLRRRLVDEAILVERSEYGLPLFRRQRLFRRRRLCATWPILHWYFQIYN